ncbi:MAG: Mur ligase family protein, partial [Alphaproteobacteria bacterium]
MTPLWTHGQAAAATGGTNRVPWSATGVSIDSRTVGTGDLFVAIVGPNADGHRYVADALARGAAAAVVAQEALPSLGLPETAPLLAVADTLVALEDLARAARARSRARIVGITGSVGKTSTKEALGRALARLGPTTVAAGNLNNHWGMPLTLTRLPADAAYGVFELGMNHAGEIAALTDILQPHVAVVTTVAAAHAAHFASEEAIADAKAEIFLGVVEGGAAVINRDNRHFTRLSARAAGAGVRRILGFGEHEAADIRLLDCTLHAACSAVRARIGKTVLDYSFGAPGRQIVLNSLAVLGA